MATCFEVGFYMGLFRCHDKVVLRSHQGQNSSKWLKITFFAQLHSLGMSKMIENNINLNTATQHNRPTHTNTQHMYITHIRAIIRLWYTKIGHHHQNLEYP